MVCKGLQGKILFPWDGSLLAEKALPIAVSLARWLGTEVLVLRILLPPRANLVVAPDLGDENLVELAACEFENEVVQMCAAYGQEVNCSPEVDVVDCARETMFNLREELQDSIAAHILGRAAEPDIGLIVLGSHGANAGVGKPRGGVALRVMNGSWKPVMVVPLFSPDGSLW